MTTIKVGDRVRCDDGCVGIVLALHGPDAWVDIDDDLGPTTYDADRLTLLPPVPVAVSWCNVYPWRLAVVDNSREDADEAADDSRLGVIVGYNDGTYTLEVAP